MSETIAVSIKEIEKALWAKLKYDATLEGKKLPDKLNEVLRDRKK